MDDRALSQYDIQPREQKSRFMRMMKLKNKDEEHEKKKHDGELSSHVSQYHHVVFHRGVRDLLKTTGRVTVCFLLAVAAATPSLTTTADDFDDSDEIVARRRDIGGPGNCDSWQIPTNESMLLYAVIIIAYSLLHQYFSSNSSGGTMTPENSLNSRRNAVSGNSDAGCGGAITHQGDSVHFPWTPGLRRIATPAGTDGLGLDGDERDDCTFAALPVAAYSHSQDAVDAATALATFSAKLLTAREISRAMHFDYDRRCYMCDNCTDFEGDTDTLVCQAHVRFCLASGGGGGGKCSKSSSSSSADEVATTNHHQHHHQHHRHHHGNGNTNHGKGSRGGTGPASNSRGSGTSLSLSRKNSPMVGPGGVAQLGMGGRGWWPSIEPQY